MIQRLLLIDDHELFRSGLRTALQLHRDLAVVGDAADARGAINAAVELGPSLAVLDLSLPGADGPSVLVALRRLPVPPRVLVLSMHSDAATVRSALAAGAAGYALKTQRTPEVIEAIRSVGRGESYLAPALRHAPVSAPARPARAEALRSSPLDALSRREAEVFQLIVRGLSNSGIAAALCISAKTVGTHRAKINRKLGTHSPAALLRLAALRGLIVE